MTITPYRSATTGKARATGLLRAEWTKLFSVPRWTAALAAAVLLTGLVSLLSALGSGDEQGATPSLNPFQDGGHYAYTTLGGNAELITQVTSSSGNGVKAGLMIRESDKPGAAFAAVLTDAASGVHLLSSVDGDLPGTAAKAPVWLKLSLSGGTVTAYSSADGTAWQRVGTTSYKPTTALGGPFVAAPDTTVVTRQFGSESITGEVGRGSAQFEHLSIGGTDPGSWTEREPMEGPAADPNGPSFTQTGPGAYSMTGLGNLGLDPFASDPVKEALGGVLIAAVTIAAIAVVAVTAEYRRGMIRTSFAVTPRRARTLLAKAAVLGGVAFAIGLLAALASYGGSGLRARGVPDITEWPVPRAIIGSGLLTALVAVYALGLGVLLKRAATAIAIALVTLTVPMIVTGGLPLSAATWLERLTPTAGFAIQQAVHRYDTAIAPWAGLAVLAGYAAIVFGLALWRQSRRDA
ncbi:hypothetical protein Afil01_27350 [Actinorhabdospora filicis]|uniref:ABC-type transport system involved in multi-copper enzyme maturation permease subunit n=1 Tax=Actinorhabdospora filicis TaxID=1785913 RepID=A0A9W6SKI8_9ACTN|nr:ABC transporter permease subunit [Actinorhabdospora filicis]GLZ77928.1 hypothetical protein Afil01_27350 [Actinorhabdospora filicis]